MKNWAFRSIDKYKILLNIYRISKNLIEQETVDKIRINKEVEQELEVISSNNISKLIKEENGKYLFYFEDNLPERSNNIRVNFWHLRSDYFLQKETNSLFFCGGIIFDAIH